MKRNWFWRDPFWKGFAAALAASAFWVAVGTAALSGTFGSTLQFMLLATLNVK